MSEKRAVWSRVPPGSWSEDADCGAIVTWFSVFCSTRKFMGISNPAYALQYFKREANRKKLHQRKPRKKPKRINGRMLCKQNS